MRAGRCSGFPGSSCRLNDPGLSRRPARVSYHGPVFLKLVRRENRQTRRQPSPGCPSHLFHLRQKPWNFASPSDTLSDRHKIIEALPAVFRELFVGRAAPHTEPLALRQRGAVLKRIRSRPALRMSDGINRRDSRSRSTVRQAAGRQAPRGSSRSVSSSKPSAWPLPPVQHCRNPFRSVERLRGGSRFTTAPDRPGRVVKLSCSGAFSPYSTTCPPINSVRRRNPGLSG